MRYHNRLGRAVMIAAGIAALAPAVARAQASPAPADPAKSATIGALLRDISQAERKLLGLAEAMPEASYSWRPSEGVRSVGEVVMHVAADNYFIPTIAGVAAPSATGIKSGDYPSVQAYESRKVTKAEAVQARRDSFAHLRTAMQAVDDAGLARSMDVFGTKMTGLDLWVLPAETPGPVDRLRPLEQGDPAVRLAAAGARDRTRDRAALEPRRLGAGIDPAGLSGCAGHGT
jgi:hypothetical protein